MTSVGLILASVGALSVWRGISPTFDGWTLLVVGSVLFSEAAARRIAAVVKRVEGQMVNPQTKRRTGISPARMYLGKTDATHAKAASGTVSIWGGTLGSETDTGINVTAYNRFANVNSDKWVWVANTGHGWYLVAAECG